MPKIEDDEDAWTRALVDAAARKDCEAFTQLLEDFVNRLVKVGVSPDEALAWGNHLAVQLGMLVSLTGFQ